eukprot:COSAG05_NODE_767_length_7468_cov_379.770118_4_plen_103_part_00
MVHGFAMLRSARKFFIGDYVMGCSLYTCNRVLYAYRTVFGESVHGAMNMKDEDGFEPTSESTHLSLPTRYELANGFTSIPSRLLGDLVHIGEHIYGVDIKTP